MLPSTVAAKIVWISVGLGGLCLAIGVILALFWWVVTEYERFVKKNRVGVVPRSSFRSRLAEMLGASCSGGSLDDQWADEPPRVGGAPGHGLTGLHMWRAAVRAGQDLRITLRLPKFTAANRLIAIERAGKYWDENAAALGWRSVHRTKFCIVCMGSILTPSDAEIEMAEALCSVPALQRRNEAQFTRKVTMPWYLRLYAAIRGKDGFVLVGEESPKPVA